MSAVAISTMTKVMQETHGNPSSIHGHGRQAGKLEARRGTSPGAVKTSTYIFFTSVVGLKAANNTIIGYCLRHQEQGKHITTTAIERHASLKQLIT